MSEGGRAWVYGDDINTDLLAPAAYLKGSMEALAAHCLEDLDRDFAASVREGDVFVAGVETELHSAFGNLVTNAVRYSPEGGVIAIRWRGVADGAQFEVEDPGLGIAPEHISRITERFYRIDLAGARVRGGTGLGLAIVKHVLKRHGADLAVESELGQGSRFRCMFPIAGRDLKLGASSNDAPVQQGSGSAGKELI